MKLLDGCHHFDRHPAAIARVADAKERKRLWPEVVELYSGYRDYQERTDRQIPLVVLEPRGGSR